jgi:hypothetical protein
VSSFTVRQPLSGRSTMSSRRGWSGGTHRWPQVGQGTALMARCFIATTQEWRAPDPKSSVCHTGGLVRRSPMNRIGQAVANESVAKVGSPAGRFVPPSRPLAIHGAAGRERGFSPLRSRDHRGSSRLGRCSRHDWLLIASMSCFLSVRLQTTDFDVNRRLQRFLAGAPFVRVLVTVESVAELCQLVHRAFETVESGLQVVIFRP